MVVVRDGYGWKNEVRKREVATRHTPSSQLPAPDKSNLLFLFSSLFSFPDAAGYFRAPAYIEMAPKAELKGQ